MIEYTSLDGITIQVGENREDDWQMTESANSNHWWLNVRQSNGRHVVVCYEGDEIPRETEMDALVLAAHYCVPNTPYEKKINYVSVAKVANIIRCPDQTDTGEASFVADTQIASKMIRMIDETVRINRLIT